MILNDGSVKVFFFLHAEYSFSYVRSYCHLGLGVEFRDKIMLHGLREVGLHKRNLILCIHCFTLINDANG